MQDGECIKCGETIRTWELQDSVRCKACGALYTLQDSALEGQHAEYTFEFAGFVCVYSRGLDDCSEPCPAPNMYCEKHTSEESFKYAKQSIEYAEKNLESAKENLEKMEESRKTWLIQKVSGIGDNDAI